MEVFDVESGSNLALTGTAAQSSTYNANTSAGKAIDGDTTSGYPTSITHSQLEFGAWWLVDLGGGFDVGTITVHNRPNAAGDRLEGAVVEALDSGGNVLWSDTITGATNGSIHTFVVTAAADITPPTADLADPTSGGTVNAVVLNGRDYLDVTFAESTTEATEVERVIKQHDEVQSRWIDLTEDVKVSDEDGREMRDRRIAIDWHNFDDEVKTKFKLGEKFDRLDD